MSITLLLFGSAALTAYLTVCALYPYRVCRVCHGAGRHRSPWGGVAWRPCWRCGGTGRRVRLGRRIAEFVLGAGEDDEQ